MRLAALALLLACDLPELAPTECRPLAWACGMPLDQPCCAGSACVAWTDGRRYCSALCRVSAECPDGEWCREGVCVAGR